MKKIDWTKWSAIAEVLSAIAIVVTLLYLASQTDELREQTQLNNELLIGQARLRMLDNRSSLSLRAIEDVNLAEVLAKLQSAEQYDDLTATEQVAVREMIFRHFRNWEYEWREYDEGRLDYEDLTVPVWRSWFHGQGSWGLPPFDRFYNPDAYREGFKTFLDEEIILPGPP